MRITLTFTSEQHEAIQRALYPGDGLEAAAVVLCGRQGDDSNHRLLAHKLIEVPPSAYTHRSEGLLSWNTGFLGQVLEEAEKKGLAVLKLHSHPSGYPAFSETDDKADMALFPSVHGWVDDGLPHASAIMLPDGSIFGRAHHVDGTVSPLAAVTIVGDDIAVWRDGHSEVPSEAGTRNAQAFGEATYSTLRSLRVAVVGCSGTGSVVVELLARLLVGELVLVDDDVVEMKNMNRILGATVDDIGRLKVDVLADNVRKMGLGVHVETVPLNLASPRAVRAVASADIVFGCMDSVDGRHLLNRLATFYLQPYFDLGVRLVADGAGGVRQICGSVHYLQPGRSSLLTRELYTLEEARSAHLQRADPLAYERELEEKYIAGANEGRPAVAPVNMLFSARGVLDFLSRIHPFRDDGNEAFASFAESLTGGFTFNRSEHDLEPDIVLQPFIGRGDVSPLLGLPLLCGEPEDD